MGTGASEKVVTRAQETVARVAVPADPRRTIRVLNCHIAPPDHLGMDTRDKRIKRLRQNLTIILLTALLSVVHAGYLYLYDEPLPHQGTITKAGQTEQATARAPVVMFDHCEHGRSLMAVPTERI